jgi:hypothetical protein
MLDRDHVTLHSSDFRSHNLRLLPRRPFCLAGTLHVTTGSPTCTLRGKILGHEIFCSRAFFSGESPLSE